MTRARRTVAYLDRAHTVRTRPSLALYVVIVLELALAIAVLGLAGCDAEPRSQPRVITARCQELLAEHAQRPDDFFPYAGAEGRCKNDCAVTHADDNAIGLFHRGACFCSNAASLDLNQVVPLNKPLLCDLLTSAQEQAPGATP